MIHPDLYLIVYREQVRQRDRDLDYQRAARERHEQLGAPARTDLRSHLEALMERAWSLRTARHRAPVGAVCCPA